MSLLPPASPETYLSPRPRGRRRSCDYAEVVQALADGLSIQKASKKLGLPFGTVRGICDRLRYKYGMKTAAHLVAHFLRNGWID